VISRGDLLIAVLALMLVGALYARYWQAPVAAATVEIRSGETVVGRYPLDQDRRLEIQGRVGTSVIDIRDQRVRFLSSPCRNKVCVHGGWLSHSGDSTACLPNRVSIVLGGTAGVALDGVSF
jgi:hypothetical protein